MSTTAGAPRWQRIIEEAIEEDKNAFALYQLATLENINNSSAGGEVAPRVRTVAHRAILAPRSPGHPIVLTTTDVRTPKATQLNASTRVELAWWFPKAIAQLRIIGTAYVYPSPDFTLSDAETKTVSEERKREIEETVEGLMKAFPGAELGGEGFDWEKERRARFDSLSKGMRASWARPTPGSPLPDPNEAQTWARALPSLSEASEEEKSVVKVALKNFALVLIDPLEADYVELGVAPNRRTRFFKEGGEWKEEAIVP